MERKGHRLASAVLAGVLLGEIILHLVQSPGADFWQHYIAGQALLAGVPVNQALAPTFGRLGYPYPMFTAVLLLPLSLLPTVRLHGVGRSPVLSGWRQCLSVCDTNSGASAEGSQHTHHALPCLARNLLHRFHGSNHPIGTCVYANGVPPREKTTPVSRWGAVVLGADQATRGSSCCRRTAFEEAVALARDFRAGSAGPGRCLSLPGTRDLSRCVERLCPRMVPQRSVCHDARPTSTPFCTLATAPSCVWLLWPFDLVVQEGDRAAG